MYQCRIRSFFLTAADLESKLRAYQEDYNKYRCHSSRGGKTPSWSDTKNVVDLDTYCLKKHCRGLFQLPVAA